MRLPTSQRRGDFGVNMTPMIDVVFQLIIFFLVSSHLAKQEALLPLPLPLANSGIDSEADEGPRLTINVFGDGRLVLAGKRVDSRELLDRLREKRASEGDELEVRIRSDRSVPYRIIEPILASCAQAGVWNVTFAIYRPEDVR